MPHGTPQITVSVEAVAKPWWRSRTLWLNAAALVLAAVEAQLGLLQQLLDVNAYHLLAFGLPLANGLLRLVTSAAIAGTPAAAPPKEMP